MKNFPDDFPPIIHSKVSLEQDYNHEWFIANARRSKKSWKVGFAVPYFEQDRLHRRYYVWDHKAGKLYFFQEDNVNEENNHWCFEDYIDQIAQDGARMFFFPPLEEMEVIFQRETRTEAKQQ
jgi:hypothetical protein